MSVKQNAEEKSVLNLEQKIISKISFMPIAFACIFFFNAFINVIDVIPDFIGYIIISASLVRLGAMNPDVEASSKCFRYLVVVDLSKYASLLWVFGITVGMEQSNAILLLTFVYAVIDVILLIAAFSKLFSGLVAFGYVHENTSVLGSKRNNGRSYTEKIKSFTIAFIVIRSLFSVLPEFTVLTQTEYIEGSFVMYLYEYIGTMRGLAFVFASIFGIIWVCKIFKYFRRINKDAVFCDALINRYNSDIAPKESVFVLRYTSVARVMFIFATVFMIDLRFNGVSIVPDAIAAIFLIIGFCYVRKIVKFNRIYMIAISVIFAAVNVYRALVEYKFFDEYYYGAVYRSPEVYNAYVGMCIASVITVVAQLLVALCIIICLHKLIENHTGFTNDTNRIKALHKELKIKSLVVLVGAVVAALTELFFIFGAVKYGFADEVAIVGNIAFVISIMKVFSDIKEEMESKFMLE